MIKVLIVDDEPNVRMGLKKMIDWEGNGFKVCDEAGDADEGYKKIIGLKPDVVLMDIKMPGKLGTDMIRETREAGFNGKFIILSGYSNFEYAKEAIKYGVKSYILKPIDEDELLDILLKIKEEIKEDNMVKGSKGIVKEANLKKIILGELDDSPYDFSSYDKFTLVLLSIEEEKREEFIKKYIKVISDVDIVNVNQYTAMVFKDTKYDRILNLLSDIKEKNNDGAVFFAVVTNEEKDAAMLHDEYKSALDVMKNKFLYLEKSVVTIENCEADKEIDVEDINDYIDKVHSYVEIQDVEKIREIIRILKSYIIKNKDSEERVKSICINTLLNVRAKLLNDYELNKGDMPGNEEVIHEIYSKKSLDNTLKYLFNQFNDMSKKVSLGSSDNNIKRIISYIEKNYYKDIKLETLAEIFNYNSAYLGKLLKNTLGENFNTKLDKIRIENAKSLLINDKLKVYQVCEKVGYKNIDYFHSKFKKYVGTTPLSFKKDNKNKNK